MAAVEYERDDKTFIVHLSEQVGDFDVAEEAAQEAFAAAVDQWPTTGIPESPRAWTARS